ncbi:Uncharacterised protein [Mycobacteroides abscessus subsp. abscessus]|uniref:hypothetical protein n=1 Tax=Mycobacteroides abscessus TaxID=36809 RepID=UPI00092C5FEA|nr:hypothetical protein [Mycobacteroides abscessus]SHU64192.1 Uncharacterised protein [Mycobacteroides abscessus subsp. abscessus]
MATPSTPARETVETPAAQPGRGLRLILVLSAYAPLVCILGVRFEHPGYRAGFIAAGIMLAAAALLVLWWRARRTRQATRYVITEIGSSSTSAQTYLLIYLLAFVGSPEPTVRDLACYSIVIALVLTVHARSTLFQINPVLMAAGYRLQHVSAKPSFSGYLLTRRSVQVGDEIAAAHLCGDVLATAPQSNSTREGLL